MEVRAVKNQSDSSIFTAPRTRLQFLGYTFDPDLRYNLTLAMDLSPLNQEGSNGKVGILDAYIGPEALVAVLYGEGAQRTFAEFAFRQTHQAVAQAFTTTFVHPTTLFTISELERWDHVFASLFGQQGSWTKALEELTLAQ